MRQEAAEVMGIEPQVFPMSDNLGESVSAWVRHRFRRDAAKTLAQFAGLDVKTAQNVIAGHLSASSFTKLIRAFGWPFLLEVGAAVLRETYDEAIQRELEEIADAQARLDSLEVMVRARREALRARRALGGGGLRLVSEDGCDAARPVGGTAGAVGSDPHPR